ncbi:hypothetical protein L1987_86282 [Smallanthus sonchifolius]|uniref:Uncharacterized protein n=1 Tax=Smallanthus sonchifolius TaxID=185202 RepID=A0ACB8Y327_9ASTR|nr:hypothetical protein L1987_86282 [Smallanthus sonchifolius]
MDVLEEKVRAKSFWTFGDEYGTFLKRLHTASAVAPSREDGERWTARRQSDLLPTAVVSSSEFEGIG